MPELRVVHSPAFPQVSSQAQTVTTLIRGNCSLPSPPVDDGDDNDTSTAPPPPPPPPPAFCVPDKTVTTTSTIYTYTLTVAAPPDGNKAPPTYYWLSVLDQGAYFEKGKWVPGKWVPNSKGQPVRVVRANGFVSSAVREAKITHWDSSSSSSTGTKGKWWKRRIGGGQVRKAIGKWFKKWWTRG